MNKGVVLGAGLGFGLLVLLGGYGFFVSAKSTIQTAPSAVGSALIAPSDAPIVAPPSAATQPAQSANSNSTELNKAVAVGAPPLVVQQSVAEPAKPQKVLSAEERTQLNQQVEARIAAFSAKGAAVSMGDTRKFLDDIQTLGQGQFDSSYFSAMRQIVLQGQQVQGLSNELSQLASDRSPKAGARRTEIMAEMRDAADRISTGAKSLQSIATTPVKTGQK